MKKIRNRSVYANKIKIIPGLDISGEMQQCYGTFYIFSKVDSRQTFDSQDRVTHDERHTQNVRISVARVNTRSSYSQYIVMKNVELVAKMKWNYPVLY